MHSTRLNLSRLLLFWAKIVDRKRLLSTRQVLITKGCCECLKLHYFQRLNCYRRLHHGEEERETGKVDRVTYHHTPSYKRIGKKGERRAYFLWWRVASIINIIIIIINSHSFERSLIAELSPAKCRSIVSCEELLSWICSGVAVKWRQWNWHRHS